MPVRRVFERVPELAAGERLHQASHGAALAGRSVGRVPVPGNHDQSGVGKLLAQLSRQPEAVTIGHADIAHGDRGGGRRHPIERVSCARGFDDGVAVRLYPTGQELPDSRFIVDNKERLHVNVQCYRDLDAHVSETKSDRPGEGSVSTLLFNASGFWYFTLPRFRTPI